MIYLSYINIRTFIVLILSMLSCFLTIQYHLKIHFNIVLFGLAIAFPLATAIQTAFKRREKALEYLSLFKSGMLVIHYSFQSSKKLEAEKKLEIAKVLNNAADKLLNQLRISNGDMVHFQEEADKIMIFMQQNREAISARILTRVIRYLKDALDGAAYLLSLTRHRTMKGLRFYSIFFIGLFTILHAPILVDQIDQQLPEWAIYPLSAFSSLILVTLYNFQEQIEYPFDQKGADDIKLDDFKLNI